MKKFTSVIAITVAAVLVIGSATVIATEKKRPQGRFSRQQIELTEEQKAERKAKTQEKAKEMLAKQLEEGKITQEEYDEKLAKIESGEFEFGGHRRGHGQFGGRGRRSFKGEKAMPRNPETAENESQAAEN